MHPNHQHNLYNHKPTTTQPTTTTSIPVHSTSNNRLINNTVFHNNQYTFSLNRYDDSGYLESRPLSSASLYGDGHRISRGTKSDIGVPCRRPSKSQLNSSTNIHYNHRDKDKLPSVKSDFLLSYLNNNHNDINNMTSNSMPYKYQMQSNQNLRNLNNNSDLNDCTNSMAYHIPCVSSATSTNDFLDTYTADAKCFYSNNSKLNVIDQIRTTNPSQILNEYPKQHQHHQQRNSTSNATNHSNDSIIFNDRNKTTTTATSLLPGSYENRQASNVVGPLLYIDPTSEASYISSNPNMIDKSNHSFDSVSKSPTNHN